jgi:hypothetical protein
MRFSRHKITVFGLGHNFHRGVVKDFVLLRYDAALLDNRPSTFRRNVMPYDSGVSRSEINF